MSDSAPVKVFSSLLQHMRGLPKVTGRPPKPSTIADLAQQPKGMQTVNPTRAKLPKMQPVPSIEKLGKR